MSGNGTLRRVAIVCPYSLSVYGGVQGQVLGLAHALRRLGIETRAAMLKKAAPSERAAEIEAAMGRLVSQTRTGMGRLFKVIGFAHEKFGVLPGFES